MNKVFISLGSNLGDREAAVNRVFQVIRAHSDFSNADFSSIYETKPLKAEGSDYLNAVAAFNTSWDVLNIYHWMMALEMNAGRERTTPHAPRTLDIDLLFYGHETINTIQLSVPHPRLHERAFVLVPLAEIAPHWIHPIYKKSVHEMRNALSVEQLLEVEMYSRTPSRREVLAQSNASLRDGGQ